MFHFNDIANTTPGAKVTYAENWESEFERGGFATTGLFGNILYNGAYPITRSYWWVATMREKLKGYIFLGTKTIATDSRIVVACFKKQNEDKGAYIVYLNDNQNTGIQNINIPLPDGVTNYDRVTVYVPEIPNPENVPNTLGSD